MHRGGGARGGDYNEDDDEEEDDDDEEEEEEEEDDVPFTWQMCSGDDGENPPDGGIQAWVGHSAAADI